ncbi:NADPH-dependent FMN reductase [Streptomyces sp. QH1-20]|uniref:NADPH-dependent FMN reductase n=1 Tax=Streptomyces sp. QH1-20 TaxID=3240934 RepID=UPI0035114C7F
MTSTPAPATAERPLRIAVLVASTREGRFAPTITAWFTGQAALHTDLSVDVIDLDVDRLPMHLTAERPAEVTAMAGRLAAADGFVVITPEYNRSFPAPLKAAIDWYQTEWQAKPVGFVTYGGVSGGLRAAEQLRLVFGELHAAPIREVVTFANYPERFDAEGRPTDEGCNIASKGLLEQLTWWARALRTAREAHPYA